MSNIIFLNYDDVLFIHQQQIELFGGTTGIREISLLESALAMPKSSFDNDFLHTNIFEMASSYLFHICSNHPFIDGNKRTSIVSMETFLELNNYKLNANDSDLENLVLGVAKGDIKKEKITKFLEKNCKNLEINDSI